MSEARRPTSRVIPFCRVVQSPEQAAADAMQGLRIDDKWLAAEIVIRFADHCRASDSASPSESERASQLSRLRPFPPPDDGPKAA